LFAIAEDLRKMKLLVSIKEADIGRVVAEQTATFKVDAWPSRTYTAKVKKVAFGSSNNQGGSGSNTGASATGVVTYTAELEVINDDLSLRPGMTAAVDIAVLEKNEVNIVSNAALRFNPNLFASIGKPDETKRNLVQSLTTGNSRRMKSKSTIPSSGAESNGPRVFAMQEGQLVEKKVATGISDGRYTEVLDGSLATGTLVVVNTKPKPKK
jgi:HlyD family secretion protein